jgi:nucleotide-binding universal stress UspA family protein
MGGKVMTRILVPTDFSEPSLVAVRYGLELATQPGRVVALLHVVEEGPVCSYVVGGPPLCLKDMIDPGGDYFRFPVDQKRIHRDLCEEARWKLDALVPPGCLDRVHTVVTLGNVVHEIVGVAKEQRAELILMGVRHRSGWRHLFRRSIAERIRRKAPIPVITLDADDLRAEGALRRRGGLKQPPSDGRVAPHSLDRVHAVKDGAPSRGRLSVAARSPRQEEADDGPEQPGVPHSAVWDERDGRRANKPSRAIKV